MSIISQFYQGGAPGEVWTPAVQGPVYRYTLIVESGAVQHGGVFWQVGSFVNPGQYAGLVSQELPVQATLEDTIVFQPFIGQANSSYRVTTIEGAAAITSTPGVVTYDATTTTELAAETTKYAYTARIMTALGATRRVRVTQDNVTKFLGPLTGPIVRSAENIVSFGTVNDEDSNPIAGDPKIGVWVVSIEGGASFARKINLPAGAGGVNRLTIDGVFSATDGFGLDEFVFVPPAPLPTGTP